jgi:membrane-bound lytic murein transglycosylase D
MATSTASAVGAWQFIESTGNQYGLKNNAWYDARRDILASTEAALTLLDELNERFKGDWLLALAAYNCGSQCVKNAINKNTRKGKSTDFWSLPLPRETRNYVPKFLAIATVIKHADRLSIALAPISNQRYFSIVKFTGQVDLRQLAIQSGITTDKLFSLNAGYKIKQTNPTGTHRLIIPISKANSIKQNLAKLVSNDQVSTSTSRVITTENNKAITLIKPDEKIRFHQVISATRFLISSFRFREV